MKSNSEQISKTIQKRHKNCESFDQLSLVFLDEVHNMPDALGAVLEAVMPLILFISDRKSFYT